MWHRLLTLLNGRPISTVVARTVVPSEATTDASFAGWGWEGMGAFDYGAWPADWTSRIGRPEPGCDAAQRIWICECELWSCLFLCWALCQRCPHCTLVLWCDNVPVSQYAR
jgi:hypothetical protein